MHATGPRTQWQRAEHITSGLSVLALGVPELGLGLRLPGAFDAELAVLDGREGHPEVLPGGPAERSVLAFLEEGVRLKRVSFVE